MTDQPITLQRLQKRIASITYWLQGAGAEVLAPTNPYEVLRFRANNVTSIVYCDRRDKITFTGESEAALRAFFTSKPWHADGKVKPRRSSTDIRTIRGRDGNDCFSCGWPVEQEDESVDHLVPVSQGGPNHIGNKVLMHRSCNSHSGHMAAPEKIRMHVEARMARA